MELVSNSNSVSLETKKQRKLARESIYNKQIWWKPGKGEGGGGRHLEGSSYSRHGS